MKRIVTMAVGLIFCLVSSQSFGAAGDKLWGPSSTGGSNNPVYTVTTVDGMAAIAGTNNNQFLLAIYNATDGASKFAGDLPTGIVKGLATDGANLYIGGTLANATGNNTGILTLYDTNGDKSANFPKTVDYGSGAYANGGVVDVACAGGTGVITGTAFNGTSLHIKTVAYGSDGTNKILKDESSANDNYTAAAVAADGSYVAVVGTAENATGKDVVAFLYDYSNNKKWGKRYDSGHNETAVDVALDSNHNVYVLAKAYNDTQNNWDVMLIKYDSAGNLKWVKWFDMNDAKKNDHPAHLAVDSGNNIVVVGYYEMNSNDYFVAKFDSDGNLKWSLAEGNESYEDRGTAIAVDSQNNVLVTGYSNDGTNFNYRTLCINQDGNVEWRALTDGTADTYATSIAVTSDDRVVVVTGHVSDSTYTVAYEGCGEKSTNELPSGDDRIVIIKTPKADPEPANHTYIGVGEVATKKGSTMKVSVHFPQYTDSSGNPVSVNIYVAIQIPYTDKCGNYHNDLYFLNKDGHFELMTEDNPIEPWKKNVTEDVSEEVIPTFSLKDPLLNQNIYPDTTYWFYTLVVPSSVKDDLTDLDPNGKWECTYFSLELY